MEEISDNFDHTALDAGNPAPLPAQKPISPLEAIKAQLLAAGISPAGIAGILANIHVETGGTFDPAQRQVGGGPGRGLFQMERNAKGTGMRDVFTNRFGEDFSAENQIGFFLQELDKGEHIGAGHAGKMRNAFANGTPEEAMDAVLNRFERPGVPHRDRRLEALKLYGEL